MQKACEKRSFEYCNRTASRKMFAQPESCRYHCWSFIAIVLLFAPQAGSAQEDAVKFSYKGAAECAFCHSNKNNLSDWVDLDVSSVWRNDVHSKSHYALDPQRNSRTAAIEKGLKITAIKDKNCLACHTKNVEEPSADNETNVLHNGISCESCHGPASGYIEEHRKKTWRFLTSEQKHAKGMIDLRNPVFKAEKCLSCHLGNVAENKVVTHEMFAAGHPPLPSFEMETFGNAMPRHWRHVWEKAETVQKAAKEAKYDTEADSETQRAIIGSLVALGESAKLLEDQAKTKSLTWPELSHYDCQACHHDLRVPSWRQDRGYAGLVPGRPSVHQWPRQLADVGLPSGTNSEQLFKPLTAILNDQAFGDRNTIAAEAAKVTANVKPQVKKVTTLGWHDANRKTIVTKICEQGSQAADFESARQLAWALNLAFSDGQVQLSDRSRKIVDVLASELLLKIRDEPADAPSSEKESFWARSLARAHDYDSAKVRKAFQLLAKELGGDGKAAAAVTAAPK